MAKQEKKSKPKRHQFYGINIKLQSNKKHGALSYIDLMKDLYDMDEPIKLIGDRVITMRSIGVHTSSKNNTEQTYITGEIVSYTNLLKGPWYNKSTKDFQNQSLPANIFPNAKQIEFLFVPAAHRFYFKINSEIQISSVLKYLTSGLNKVIKTTDKIVVTLITSNDAIDEIISSKELLKLNITITYTNDDIGDKATTDMDNLLKEANIGEAEINLVPDNSGSLDTKSKLIKGYLGLAKENGSAVASIKDNNGKKKTIKTTKYPEKISILVDKTKDVFHELFKFTLESYRDG